MKTSNAILSAALGILLGGIVLFLHTIRMPRYFRKGGAAKEKGLSCHFFFLQGIGEFFSCLGHDLISIIISFEYLL